MSAESSLAAPCDALPNSKVSKSTYSGFCQQQTHIKLQRPFVCKSKKSGKFHELPRKLIHFINPPPRMERGMGGREGGDREGERERESGRQGRRGPSKAG